ncbi:uncharacterized protein LOC105796226 [Gossypium raimondii]|uniref:uncharacterized protein LOC105796226 n=1 Tax=Gossypium raimondii TaxID=29730 RepID=UPI00063AB2DB|nr:uncharacterized protein LOC105796226 [Gossypium raimondii]
MGVVVCYRRPPYTVAGFQGGQLGAGEEAVRWQSRWWQRRTGGRWLKAKGQKTLGAAPRVLLFSARFFCFGFWAEVRLLDLLGQNVGLAVCCLGRAKLGCYICF